MPLASANDVVNLALDHLGEPYLSDYLTQPGTTAEAARLHYQPCVETVLEGHAWSFATRSAHLVPVGAYVAPDETGYFISPGLFFEPATAEALPVVSSMQSVFWLPEDCLRLLKIDTDDFDVPRNRFEIQGRYLLLVEAGEAPPVAHYITQAPPVADWPTTFVDAVAYLLAARMSHKLTQNPNVMQALMQRHEIALGKARSKDTRETRSKENHGPRALAARSGLVNARYGFTPPPY